MSKPLARGLSGEERVVRRVRQNHLKAVLTCHEMFVRRGVIQVAQQYRALRVRYLGRQVRRIPRRHLQIKCGTDKRRRSHQVTVCVLPTVHTVPDAGEVMGGSTTSLLTFSTIGRAWTSVEKRTATAAKTLKSCIVGVVRSWSKEKSQGTSSSGSHLVLMAQFG